MKSHISNSFLCAAILTMSCIPFSIVHAAGPNGEYRVIRAEGNIQFAGATLAIPGRLIEKLAKENGGSITVENRELQINRKGAVKMAEYLGEELGLNLVTRVKGPTSIKLVKLDGVYSGGTSEPVIVSFKDALFVKLIGTFQVSIDAEARNGNLTLTMPIGGKFLSTKIGGTISIVCSK